LARIGPCRKDRPLSAQLRPSCREAIGSSAALFAVDRRAPEADLAGSRRGRQAGGDELQRRLGPFPIERLPARMLALDPRRSDAVAGALGDQPGRPDSAQL
jgi:hypothetical protein